jgi:hypothetical protein
LASWSISRIRSETAAGSGALALLAGQQGRALGADRERGVPGGRQFGDLGECPGDVIVHLPLVVSPKADIEERFIAIEYRQKLGVLIVCCHASMVARQAPAAMWPVRCRLLAPEPVYLVEVAFS